MHLYKEGHGTFHPLGAEFFQTSGDDGRGATFEQDR